MGVKGSGLFSVVEVARYRGRFGELDWVLRRIAGLGVILFLVIHIVDTGTVYFAGRAAYQWWVELYKNPIFGAGEIVLAACVVYHAMSGLAIIVLDFVPSLWRFRPQARLIVWALFLIVFSPIGAVMTLRFVQHNLIR